MKEIELSTMIPREALGLEEFEQSSFTRAIHRLYDWDTAWSQILQIGLYQKGPDVSEMGSTWLENLNDMRALRPFSASEIQDLGGEDSFLSSAWPQENTTLTAMALPRRVISIPWTLDTRLICYRRDVLAQAGVREEQAFATPEAFFDTLLRIQSLGIPYPLAMETGSLSIHNMASWVWGRGGHFRSDDYHKIALVEPDARQGMVDFFRLHPFIYLSSQGDDPIVSRGRYYQGEAAVLFSGQWVMKPIKDRRADILPEVLAHTGYSMPPGVPFVGSSHLVIWRHSLFEQDCVRLINHLTSPEVLASVFEASGNLPARASALQNAPFSTDPDYQLAVECIRRGRMVRSARLWGGVESRVNLMCDTLWKDLAADPKMDLPAEIERRVRDLAARLEKTIMANW